MFPITYEWRFFSSQSTSMTKMKLNDKEILIPKREKQTPIVVKKASHTLIAMKPVEKKKDHSLYVSLVSSFYI